jgi:hypothetical protein
MKYLLPVVLALFACSCATVVRGTSDTARFESTPSGAGVMAESISEDKMGPYNCVTPCELELKRKRTWRVDFRLEGYKPVAGLLKPVVTGGGVAAGAGNVLIGGLIGVGIDAGTGANMDLQPNPMIAELEPIGSPNDSRILDAEIIVEDQAEEEGVPEEGAETNAPAEEAPVETDETEEPAPAGDLPADEDGLQSSRERDPDENLQNVTLDSGGVAMPAVEFAGPSAEEPNRTEIRLYNPGERAPNDEESRSLNQRQLDKIKPLANQGGNP